MPGANSSTSSAREQAAKLLRRATAARKCLPCACAHQADATILGALGDGDSELAAAAVALHEGLEELRYECLGCPVCWPADAMGLLQDAGLLTAQVSACPVEQIVERPGWPPLPGAYTVLRWQAPVAVCTLADDQLASAVAQTASPAVALVGTLRTENLGIERVVRNIIANPNLRYLILSGTEPRQAIGHLPGGSLLALGANGIDDRRRIIDAPGRRPFLKNLSEGEIERFRRTVTVVDLVGETDPGAIHDAVARCASNDPGAVEEPAESCAVEPIQGHLLPTMTSDPAGYVVLYADMIRERLVVEHFTNAGVLDAVVEGETAAECYTPLVERGLVSRLDHAAYIGRELARAEAALASGSAYVQDGAPVAELPPRTCGSGCSSASAQPVRST